MKLIDGDAFVEKIQKVVDDSRKDKSDEGKFTTILLNAVIESIKKEKEAVVRCKDCKWRYSDGRTFWEPCDELKVTDDWFCADGERREEEIEVK